MASSHVLAPFGQPTTRHPNQLSRVLTSLLVVAIVGAVLWLAVAYDVPRGIHGEAGYVALAAVFGAVVGAAELISRYRDEPTRALLTSSAATYLAVNALVSGLTYGLLTRYASGLLPGLASDPLMRSIVAGFGAMAILRSKFFTLRTAQGEDVSVGPDAAVGAFLAAADRGVDRSRARSRMSLVFRSAEAVKKPEVGPDFMEISIAALQNLSQDDKAQFVESKKRVVESNYPEILKLQAICYDLLTRTGERNFEDIMANLQTYITDTESADEASTATPKVSPGAGIAP
jgi:hypothetical protein